MKNWKTNLMIPYKQQIYNNSLNNSIKNIKLSNNN